MQLLKEVLAKVRRLDDKPSETDEDLPTSDNTVEPSDGPAPDEDSDDIDLDVAAEDPHPVDDDFSPIGISSGGSSSPASAKQPSEQPVISPEETLPSDAEEPSLDSSAQTGQQSGDPDRQGLIRTVKNAHLVYKRQIENGTFEELWIYSMGTFKDELDTRKAILSGTDIPVNSTRSEDGSQEYHMWSAGNAEIVHITGLPN